MVYSHNALLYSSEDEWSIIKSNEKIYIANIKKMKEANTEEYIHMIPFIKSKKKKKSTKMQGKIIHFVTSRDSD